MPTFYPHILRLTNTNDTIYAIADRSNNPEDFWQNRGKTSVRERTFFLPWKDFFSASSLSKFYNILQKDKESTLTKYSHVPLAGFPNFFEDREGYNMFIAPKSNIVGYYVIRNRKRLLKIIFDRHTTDLALQEYKELTKDALDFEGITSFDQLRQNWVQKNRFGEWSYSDSPVERRDNRYFDYYDIHIRCWIWMYDELIENTVQVIKSSLIDKIPLKNDRQIKVLEIGYGTGEVTIPVLSWLNSVNKNLENNSPDSKIRFFGIDRGYKRMLPILKQKN